jgi:hypothetical protein
MGHADADAATRPRRSLSLRRLLLDLGSASGWPSWNSGFVGDVFTDAEAGNVPTSGRGDGIGVLGTLPNAPRPDGGRISRDGSRDDAESKLRPRGRALGRAVFPIPWSAVGLFFLFLKRVESWRRMPPPPPPEEVDGCGGVETGVEYACGPEPGPGRDWEVGTGGGVCGGECEWEWEWVEVEGRWGLSERRLVRERECGKRPMISMNV